MNEAPKNARAVTRRQSGRSGSAANKHLGRSRAGEPRLQGPPTSASQSEQGVADQLREDIRLINEITFRQSGAPASAMAAIGMLASSGLGAKRIVRLLTKLIRQVMPVDVISLHWSDEQGSITAGYNETAPFQGALDWWSGHTAILDTPVPWPKLNETGLAGSGARQSPVIQPLFIDLSLRSSEKHDPTPTTHVFDAVVLDGDQPRGCLQLVRSTVGDPFTVEEVNRARRVARLLLPAFSVRPDFQTHHTTRTFEAGAITFGADAVPIFCDHAARQSLSILAQANGMQPESRDAADASVRAACVEGVHHALREGRFKQDIASSWGDYSIYFERVGDSVVSATIRQSLPLAGHLAWVLSEHRLPPRRLVVCWLAMLGTPRKQIARLTGLSPYTVDEHMNAVLEQFGVKSLLELALRVIA